jgi:pyrroline-5-carboxylate reductase
MNKQIIAFIGGGNMGEALLQGILRAGLYAPADIRVADVDPGRLQCLRANFKVAVFRDNPAAVADAGTMILAVKPKVVPAVLAELKPHLSRLTLVVSIAAGIRTAFIEKQLPRGARVIRVMPNTAALVGKGAAAFCCGRRATAADAQRVEAIFKAVGIVVRVKEADLDAVTALSGSGPAYVFYLVESMEQAAEKMGLTAAAARALAVATVEGAAHLLAETGLDPEELRRRVTSKGGTTEAAFRILEERQVLESFVAAMRQAHQRSRQLSQ